MKKVLVIGQTPPPYGGQAMMIKYMLDGQYKNMKLYHVRMCFSKEFNDRGKFSLYKITQIFAIIYQVWLMRFKHNIHTVYYPVSSAPKVALLRDVAILMCTKFLFKDVIFHFHAAGVSEELPKYPIGLRQFCYSVLKKPSLGITSSKFNPKDAEYLKSNKVKVVPLGIPDMNEDEVRKEYGQNTYLTIMFMGLLNSTKGEGYVLDAVNILNHHHKDVRFIFAGRFENEEYKNEFMTKVREYGLEGKVEYRGVVTGDAKKKMFLEADVFCFPSFFSSESFGIVMLEGMMYQMPIIASRWRGVQSVVKENQNGYLVDVRNAQQIADVIGKLYDDRSLLKEMAIRSRKIFKQEYDIAKYLENMEKAIVEI